MELLESTQDGMCVLPVIGRVNSANAPQLGERLLALLDRGCRAIVIDLSRLEHLTSAGFRSLLIAEKQAGEANAAMVLCGLSGLTLELFEIGGFIDMFTIVSSRAEAVSRSSAASPAA